MREREYSAQGGGHSRRQKKAYENRERLRREIRGAAGDILASSNFRRTRRYIQHGDMTVSGHCLDVAEYSLRISESLHIPCSRRELIRGALLHDYFLYDWHDREHRSPARLHGFYHPGIALRNASREYPLTEREKEIIRKHMWPLTVVPPTCREAWIVTCADKYCSLMEVLRFHRGQIAALSG